MGDRLGSDIGLAGQHMRPSGRQGVMCWALP
jgi:hypothetical protein